MANFPRRQFLFTAGAAAAVSILAHGCSNNSPSATTNPATEVSANAPAVETSKAKLGFIALTDAAPLIIAKEKGFFAKYGMTNVDVIKQTSWPVTRDNLAIGSSGGGIDGAHILTPMPYLMTISKIVPMYILARLNVNGQGISLANKFKEFNVQLDSKALKAAASKAKSDQKPLKFGMTFPGGTHDLWMRYWLAAGGINPDQDVVLSPVPPPQMVANMKVNTIDSFCVGEPWNAQLVNQEIGYSALVTGELWNNHPEKAFAMRQDWVNQNPNAAQALLMAIIEAQQWCDKLENTEEMCKICSGRKYFNVAVADILDRFKGNIDYGDGRKKENFAYRMKFWADNASYPYQSHDIWFLTENIRWGYLPKDLKIQEIVNEVNKEDLWKQAAKAVNVPDYEIPSNTSRGIETFFDGVKFDPEKPQEYLNSLKIKKV
ncbi:CmpA/NrtA family ABC transporter substrate-binding protein [Umezakia ovalisporum]|jgi:nitrate/nitrite transport system substrate-binding protein|uniref:ABC transporter substrate-binding protein n=2 Tax=Umezakia ovalisporum TaxID=75695 RepID=A0AA43KEH1_9CYAN|nr:CmpA/NrtA family ABC transporter substrate-binding protein [Umezakia ovalisporum]MBI1242066.1 bicarbonate-binding protein [Nostoc sp. RI_552]MDH6056675.1 ABC transporter substrate-binding protein [Umezakia ovalisporum FSS-43]MDH6062983.1 ABC transporter substrate-binding protein [Umezakia ovalisporum FSS-62]MDH6068631.1 ABC transporter substrate-binding protein [Umezakia ovalisporum APH033B]MDH6070143.1 ABC transporter substrate-binding protein [Umezakia ovalisporum CobakiLakeA]